jgi:hypothetical protein
MDFEGFWPDLRRLSLIDMGIEELTALPQTLVSLNLYKNPELCHLPVLPMGLERLVVARTGLRGSDRFPRNVRYLDISKTRITDLGFLKKFKSLQFLGIAHLMLRKTAEQVDRIIQPSAEQQVYCARSFNTFEEFQEIDRFKSELKFYN